MVDTAFSNLAGIGGGIVMNIVKGIGILAFAVVAYYGTRWYQKNSKKQKSFTINADILDMNGVLEFDKLGFVKTEETGMLEMNFQTRTSDSIPPIPKHLIKAGRVLLLNFAPGHYAVIDTSATIRNYEKGISRIELYNLGMKKYIQSKQRQIMNNAEKKSQAWATWGPWVSLGGGIIGAVLLAAFLFYFGAQYDTANIAKRTEECISLGWKP